MDLVSAPHTVTVHRVGATVTRRVPVATPVSGPVRLPGLPLALVDGSVQVTVEGGDAELRAVRVELHARPRQESPLTPDHAALRTVRRALTHARRTIQQLTQEIDVFSGLPMPERPQPPEGAPIPPSPLAARVALDGFVDDRVRERQVALRAVQDELEALATEEAALLHALHSAGAARQARPDELSKAVTAELVVRGATDALVLVLSYRIPGARWVPQYALDVARDGSSASLVLRAAVAQASGEDWTGVELVLSTAEPLAPCPLPVLHALKIGRAQPAPPAPIPRPAPAGAERLLADFDRARRALTPPVPPAPPAVRPAEPMELLGRARDMDEESAAEMFDDAPAPERQESRKRMSKAAPMPAMAPAMASGGPPPRPARQAAAQVPTAPAYDQLRLRPPDDPRRGTLAVVGDDERHRELFAKLAVEVVFDLGSLLTAAQQRATSVAGLPLPGGTVGVHPDRFDHAMRAEAPVDVPGDGAWHTLPVLRAEGGCALRYVGAPRAEAAMYRVARLPNPLRCPLLPGPVEVYVSGAYVLTTDLPAAGPGEELALGLGVEPALRIARNTRFHEARSGDRVAMTELHHHIEIAVHNTLGRPAEIELRERVPQPDEDAEVAIDEVAVQPPWVPWDQSEDGPVLQGGRRWSLTVPAGATSHVSAHYVVRLYANHEVVGGNRREA